MLQILRQKREDISDKAGGIGKLLRYQRLRLFGGDSLAYLHSTLNRISYCDVSLSSTAKGYISRKGCAAYRICTECDAAECLPAHSESPECEQSRCSRAKCEKPGANAP